MNNLLRFYCSLIFVMLFFVACDEDPCEGVNCGNGVCDTVSGNCNCSRGYQHDASGICSIEWTAKMVKTYSVSDSCTGSNPGTTLYSSTISSTSPSTFTVSNFMNMGHTVNASHINSLSFNINDTLINNKRLTGSGLLQDTVISIDYIYGDTLTGVLDTCRAELR